MKYQYIRERGVYDYDYRCYCSDSSLYSSEETSEKQETLFLSIETTDVVEML